MKKLFFAVIRVLLLSVVIILGFTIVFPGWLDNRHIIFEEFSNRFRSNDDIALREEARRNNIDFDEYKASVLAKREVAARKAEFLSSLDKAQRTGDHKTLKSTLSKMPIEDVPNTLFATTFEFENIGALKAMADVGFKCQLKQTDEFKKPSTQWITQRAIRNSNNPDVFAEWVELGCYTDQMDFIENLIVQKKQSLFSSLPINEKTTLFWQDVLWVSIDLGLDEYATGLISSGVGRVNKNEAAILELQKGINTPGWERDVLQDSIKFKLPLLTKQIITEDRNYVRRNQLSKIIVSLLFKRSRELSVNIFMNEVLEAADVIDSVPEQIGRAITNRDIGMLRLLLSLDPDYRLNKLDDDQLANIDRALNLNQVIHLPALHERGLDFNAFDYHGLDQLSQAMYLGDLELVKQFLDLGVNPKIFYRGRSILSSKIGGDDLTKEAILTALNKAGATDDLGVLVRIETGKKLDQSCAIGKPSVSTFQTPDYYQPLKKIMSERQKETLTAHQVCEVALLMCTKSKTTSLDDCFESVPACPQRVIDNGFKMSVVPPAICCPSSAKKTYNEMRCSGLDVISAASMLSDSGFSEIYGIPQLILNSRAYQEHSEKVDFEMRQKQKGRY